jgi:Kef-type K+ transport system membrane component KefB
VYSLLSSIALVIIATKLLGELARRFGQPSVLGGLLAGALLGDSAFGLLDPRDPAMHALAELGVLILIFQIGLRTDWRSLMRVDQSVMAVAGAGFVLPFAAGFGVARALGAALLPSLLAGATLTATSTGIATRVLADAGALKSREAEVVLGAALADTVLGLILLAAVVALSGGAMASASQMMRNASWGAGFVVASLAIGSYAMPPLFRLLDRIRGRDSMGLFGLSFAVLLAAIAATSGSGMITGAFLAGMILHPTPQRQEIERTATSLGHFFVPIFFATIGASVDLPVLGHKAPLLMGAALTAVAILAKVASGFAPWWFRGEKLVVGIGMIPRGEIGLIFMQVGLAAAALTPALFGSLMIAVVATTVLAPPLMKMVVDSEQAEPEFERPGAWTPEGRRQTKIGRRH